MPTRVSFFEAAGRQEKERVWVNRPYHILVRGWDCFPRTQEQQKNQSFWSQVLFSDTFETWKHHDLSGFLGILSKLWVQPIQFSLQVSIKAWGNCGSWRNGPVEPIEPWLDRKIHGSHGSKIWRCERSHSELDTSTSVWTIERSVREKICMHHVYMFAYMYSFFEWNIIHITYILIHICVYIYIFICDIIREIFVWISNICLHIS